MTSAFSIRSWSLAALVLAGALAVVPILFLFLRVGETSLREAASQRMEDHLRLAESMVVNRVERIVEQASGIAAEPEFFAATGEGGDADQDLARIARFYRALDYGEPLLTLFDLEGLPVASTTHQQIRDQGSTQVFGRALSGEPSVVGPHRLYGEKDLYLSIFHPVFGMDGKTPKWVVRHHVSLATLHNELQTLGTLRLVGEEGSLLLGPEGERLFEPISDILPFRGDGVAEDRGGERHLLAVARFSPLPGQIREWELNYTVPESEALALLGRIKRTGFMAGVMILSTLGLLGWLGSRFLWRPLQDVAQRAAQLQDQSSEPLPKSRIREINQFGEAFTSMASEVKRTRDNLEDTVRERTLAYEEVQEILEATLDGMPEALLLIDEENDRVRLANRKSADLFSSQSPLMGTDSESFAKMISAWFSDPEEWLQWWRTNRSDKMSTSRRFEMVEEGLKSLQISCGLVGDGRGQLWMFRDVSKEEVLSKILNQSQKMEAVGRLAGGVAHDFNNVLAAIQASLDVAVLQIAEGGDPQETLEVGKGACQRAAGVVAKLLKVAENPEIKSEPVQLEALAEEARALLDSSMDPRIQLHVDLPDLPAVGGDASSLHQVLLNLLLNAADAMPDGGEIWIRGSRRKVGPEEVHEEGEYVCLLVEDNGHGMAPEVSERIFEPFFSTKKGSGLGLYNSFGIVEGHGGWIECHSTPEKGTTFHVYLPVSGGSSFPKPRVLPSPVPESGVSILVVDDEEILRQMSANLLKRNGYEVESAEDGVAALEYLDGCGEKRPDLVLLDLTMPRLSGADTLLEIRKRWPEIRVIVWSGYSPDTGGLLHKEGAPDAFLRKPVAADELLGQIGETLGLNEEQTLPRKA